MKHRFRGYNQFRHFKRDESRKRNKKEGLYFGSTFDMREDYWFLTPAEVVKLRDFLSRYINYNIHKKDMELYVSTRAHARAIERNMLAAEAKLK